MNMRFEIGRYDNFIFDCDGVILDSNEVKTLAFMEVMNNESVLHRKEFIEYHIENTGISRYKKFKYYYTKIKKINNYENELDKLLFDFSNLLKKNIIKCNLTKGALIFLETLKKNNKKIYMISASDEIELQEIIFKKKLKKYFKKIYGSPNDKIENIKKLKKIGLLTNKTVFFGDSYSDYKAAKYFNMDFVFLSDYSLMPIKKMNVKLINNFSSLDIVT